MTPAVYVPFTLTMERATQILVRDEGSPLSLLGAVRKQLTLADPDQQVWSKSRCSRAVWRHGSSTPAADSR